MRDISFRAYDIIDKRMVTDGAIQINNGVVFGHEDLVIMQFTGLKDSTGKDIYESDILKEGDNIIKVIFDNGMFIGMYINDGLNLGNSLSSCLCLNTMEIIGNLYENPELLNND